MKARAVLCDLGNTLLEYRLHGQWQAFLHRRLAEVFETGCDRTDTALTPAEFAERAAEVIGLPPLQCTSACRGPRRPVAVSMGWA
jgi:hypothetical protein